MLSHDGKMIISKGTPVIIFGTYTYGTPPWKKLPEDPNATTVPLTEIQTLLDGYASTLFPEIGA